MDALDIFIGFVVGGTAGTLWTYGAMVFFRSKEPVPSEPESALQRYQEFKAKKLNKS